MVALQVCFHIHHNNFKYLYRIITLHAAKQEAHADNMNYSELEFKIERSLLGTMYVEINFLHQCMEMT